MRRPQKLRDTILITMDLILTVVVLMLGLIFYRQYEKLLIERATTDYKGTITAIEKNIDSLMSYGEDFTKYLALDKGIGETLHAYSSSSEDPEKHRLKREWDRISTHLLYSTSMLYGIDIYVGQDLVYSCYKEKSDECVQNVPLEVLQHGETTNSPYWTDLLELNRFRSYAKHKEYAFGVVKNVVLETGKKAGQIVVFVRENSFSDVLKQEDPGREAVIYIVNEKGEIVSAVDNTKLFQNIQTVLALNDRDFQKCMDDQMLIRKSKHGPPLLYISQNIGDTGMRLIGCTAMTEVMAQQRKQGSSVVLLIMLSLVLSYCCAWFASMQVTRPLQKLISMIDQIKVTDGKSHLRFPEENKYEIDILGKKFNELLDQLDHSMEQIYQEQRQRRHNEVRLLQAQIVPHFLYNTMGIISSFIKLNMPDKALTTIQKLVAFYRLSLSSGKEVVTVGEEVELTQNYLALQQLRYIEYMEYSFHCGDDVEQYRIPKLTIQPLVENVLHHALRPNGEKCMVNISVDFEEPDRMLKIRVQDNGVGISQGRLQQLRDSLRTGKSVTKSFGILNVNQRLALMFGDRYYMDIESEEGKYTCFVLHIPAEKGSGST